MFLSDPQCTAFVDVRIERTGAAMRTDPSGDKHDINNKFEIEEDAGITPIARPIQPLSINDHELISNAPRRIGSAVGRIRQAIGVSENAETHGDGRDSLTCSDDRRAMLRSEKPISRRALNYRMLGAAVSFAGLPVVLSSSAKYHKNISESEVLQSFLGLSARSTSDAYFAAINNGVPLTGYPHLDDYVVYLEEYENAKNMTPSNFGEKFLTFHHLWLNQYNAFRAGKGCSSVGAWDPATPIPIFLQPAPGGRDDPVMPRATSNPYAIDHQCSIPSWATIKGGGSGDGIHGYTSLKQFQTLEELGRALKGWSDNVCKVIGGDVAVPDFAPMDPVFWALHATIDEIRGAWVSLVEAGKIQSIQIDGEEKILREYFGSDAENSRPMQEHMAWHMSPENSDPGSPGFGRRFLEFHRKVVNEYDRFRKERGLPPVKAWDPSTPLPRNLTHKWVLYGRRETSYPFSIDANCATPTYFTTDGGTDADPYFGYTKLAQYKSADELGYAMNYEDIGLPAWHNLVHNTIGGDMATFFSPADPAFFVWHKWIDEIYQNWEKAKSTVSS